MDFYPLLFIKRAIAAMVLPPAGPILLALFGFLLAHRFPRLGRKVFWLGIFGFFVMATPFMGSLLLSHLEGVRPPDAAAIKRAQAIVILGGSSYHGAPEYGGDTVGSATLQRLRYGARLARQTGLPVLVSGGAASGGSPLAPAMREALERDFGVAAKWTESGSLDTRENALFSAQILKREKIDRVLLVTQASHMRRARKYFVAAGFEVIPAPTVFSSPSPSIAYDFLPNEHGINQSAAALHEWLGLAAIELGVDAAR